MRYWQFCGILLELILSGEWGESLGVEFLEFCDLALPGALLLSPSIRPRPRAGTGCPSELWGRVGLGHTFNTSLTNNFHII